MVDRKARLRPSEEKETKKAASRPKRLLLTEFEQRKLSHLGYRLRHEDPRFDRNSTDMQTCGCDVNSPPPPASLQMHRKKKVSIKRNSFQSPTRLLSVQLFLLLFFVIVASCDLFGHVDSSRLHTKARVYVRRQSDKQHLHRTVTRVSFVCLCRRPTNFKTKRQADNLPDFFKMADPSHFDLFCFILADNWKSWQIDQAGISLPSCWPTRNKFL